MKSTTPRRIILIFLSFAFQMSNWLIFSPKLSTGTQYLTTQLLAWGRQTVNTDKQTCVYVILHTLFLLAVPVLPVSSFSPFFGFQPRFFLKTCLYLSLTKFTVFFVKKKNAAKDDFSNHKRTWCFQEKSSSNTGFQNQSSNQENQAGMNFHSHNMSPVPEIRWYCKPSHNSAHVVLCDEL